MERLDPLDPRGFEAVDNISFEVEMRLAGRPVAEESRIVRHIADDQLAKVIRDVARKGYAEVQSRQTRGVTNVAFPIKGLTGHAVAVLNVPYIERIDKKVTPSVEVVKELLRESAAQLSLLMGHVTDAGTSPLRQPRRRAHAEGVM